MSPRLTRRTFVAGAAAVAAYPLIGTRSTAMPTPPALFIAAHPDDETLAMGVAIADHVLAGVGVHVLLLTRGTTSSALDSINGVDQSEWWGIMHDPTAEGYSPLSVNQFGQARVDETTTALTALTSGIGTVTIHEAGLTSQSVTEADTIDAIEDVSDMIAPGAPVLLKTHSPIVDDHPDHIAAGDAAASLAASNPTRFDSPRYYVLPAYWDDQRLSQVTWHWDAPANQANRSRAINGCRAFGAWAPPDSYAIGYHSTWHLFDTVIDDTRSMVHS